MLSEGIRKCKNSVLFSGSKEVSLTLGWNVLTVIRFKKNKFKDFCYFLEHLHHMNKIPQLIKKQKKIQTNIEQIQKEVGD